MEAPQDELLRAGQRVAVGLAAPAKMICAARVRFLMRFVYLVLYTSNSEICGMRKSGEDSILTNWRP